MRHSAFLALAAGLALYAAPALAQALTPDETAKVDAIVTDALKSSQVPGASIAVVRDGKLVYAKAYGTLGPDVPVPTTDARFQIASVSKQFTAAAILLLADEGKLSLDDKVSKWVPDVTDADKITIRQLLSHTSGLQDYWPQDYSFAAMEKPVTPQGIVDRWGHKPLDFAPGTQWQYSNTGYVVAGIIIEKASGTDLMSYLDRKIFKPLGMHPINQDRASGKGFPTGYHRYALGPVRVEKQPASGWLWAAGELSMTPSDLAKWDIARIDRTVMPASDWDAQETPVILTNGSNARYGLGVSIRDVNGLHTIEHSGEAVGFLTENIVVPSKRFAVAAAVNADFGDAQDVIADRVRDLLVGSAAPDAAQAAATPAPAPAAPALDAGELDRLQQMKSVYAMLQQGKIERSLFTVDANYYFTSEAVKDFHDSLAPLGPPTSFEARPPRLRGGFVNRNYMVTDGGRKLIVVTYTEPGEHGRIEQFLVMPSE